MKLLVIIPTYNEKENITNIIEAIFQLEQPFEILIIDDNSPDGTADIVKKLILQYVDKLHLLQRAGKLGLGTAYIEGFEWALQRDYDYIFEMDADFSHNPKDLPRLLESCDKENADVAIGSRYSTGVNVVNWPIGRVLMSFYASKYVSMITGMKICDTTAGFVCYKRKVLETIDLKNIKFKGYAFQVEMKYTAYILGFKLKEVSIIFVNRVYGDSKMSKGIFAEGVLGILQLKYRSLTKQIKPNKKYFNNNTIKS